MSEPALIVEGLAKTFTLHLQGGVQLAVLRDLSLAVFPGECLALVGPSGAGKSTLLRALYGTYVAQAGHIHVRHCGKMLDLASADSRQILAVRRDTIGYVSQFLRVIPRVPAREIVAEPLIHRGESKHAALRAADAMLARLNLPERLWHLPPGTFSGGEQQRVNLARGFIVHYPILLIDEPTASLDPVNADIVLSLIAEAQKRNAAIVGIFHDPAVRLRVATREFALAPLAEAA